MIKPPAVRHSRRRRKRQAPFEPVQPVFRAADGPGGHRLRLRAPPGGRLRRSIRRPVIHDEQLPRPLRSRTIPATQDAPFRSGTTTVKDEPTRLAPAGARARVEELANQMRGRSGDRRAGGAASRTRGRLDQSHEPAAPPTTGARPRSRTERSRTRARRHARPIAHRCPTSYRGPAAARAELSRAKPHVRFSSRLSPGACTQNTNAAMAVPSAAWAITCGVRSSGS